MITQRDFVLLTNSTTTFQTQKRVWNAAQQHKQHSQQAEHIQALDVFFGW